MGKNDWKGWTEDRVKELLDKGAIKGYSIKGGKKEQPKHKASGRAKYGNKKVEWNGMLFDSTKEYKRYRQLLILLKKGLIGQLQRQVPYELNEGGTHSLKYVADFVYIDAKTGKEIVEDSKGYRTQEYKKRRRLMKKVHNITIKET